MLRFTTHISAAIAAIALTLVSMQFVTSVPPSQIALIDAPIVA